MRETEINLSIKLDNQQIPESISWTATDKPDDFPSSTKAFALSIWDEEKNSILSIDLWTKEMLVGEMKRFFVQTLGGLNDTVFSATGDQQTFDDVNALCEKLAKRFMEEEKKAGKNG